MEDFVVDKNVCIGCGACAAVASNTFEIGDDGLAEAIEGKNIVSKLTVYMSELTGYVLLLEVICDTRKEG